MKCIGFLGCDGSLLCADYERFVVREVTERYVGQVRASFVALTLHLPALMDASETNDRSQLDRLIATGVSALEGLGAQAVVVCTSALQPRIERLFPGRDGQLMADAVIPVVSMARRRRVGVVGAIDDEEERFWRRRFCEFGRSEALFPVAADRAHLARLIAEEFSHGLINETACADVRRILYGLRQAGAQAFVFLTPALGAVMAQADSVPPIFDATEVHALAVVDWALGLRVEISPRPGGSEPRESPKHRSVHTPA